MDGIEFIAELSRRNYQGGLILVTGVSLDMLDVARDIAELKGLKVLGCFTKPLLKASLSRVLGLPLESSEASKSTDVMKCPNPTRM